MTNEDFKRLADIVLYGDLDDETIEYVWQTRYLTEAIERYKKLTER